jgi:hypothetical protein
MTTPANILKESITQTVYMVGTEIEGLLFTLNGIGPLVQSVVNMEEFDFKLDKFPKITALLTLSAACARTASRIITGDDSKENNDQLLVLTKSLETAILNSQKGTTK